MGFIALMPIPKGIGKMGGRSLTATHPSVLAPGSALGSVPTVALSSAQVDLMVAPRSIPRKADRGEQESARGTHVVRTCTWQATRLCNGG
jgi:hypothetical protein